VVTQVQLINCSKIGALVTRIYLQLPMDTQKTTNIIHRTPWRPPVATSANGIKICLDDGRELIDGAGGAAVAAVGMGHPKIVKAIQDQVAKMACAR
jgi:4-aminobutyrate aminotransferase-like enzyme